MWRGLCPQEHTVHSPQSNATETAPSTLLALWKMPTRVVASELNTQPLKTTSMICEVATHQPQGPMSLCFSTPNRTVGWRSPCLLHIEAKCSCSHFPSEPLWEETILISLFHTTISKAMLHCWAVGRTKENIELYPKV